MKFLILSLLFVGALGRHYAGYKTLRITPQTERQVDLLASYENTEPEGLDFWRGASKVGHAVDIMVAPTKLRSVKNFLENSGLTFTVAFDDVQNLIDSQMEDILSRRNTIQAAFDYSNYHTHDEIEQWIFDTSAANSFVTYDTIATSFEGKDIYVLKLQAGTASQKKAVYFQGGIHAREWLGPATLIWITNQLISDYNAQNPQVVKLLNQFDFYIVPLLNVDGYIWTWSTDRLWRKNRNTNNGAIQACRGVDMNRNYDYQWGGAGASTSKCSDTFRGLNAHSEPEIIGSTSYLENLGQEVVLYIDFHCYSQLLLGPWSYSKTAKLPAEEKDQTSHAVTAASAIESVYGTVYETGPTARTLYAASGSSNDWGFGVLAAKYSYVIELRDTGNYGFEIPPNQIVPSGEETYQAVLSFGETIMTEF